MGLGHIIQSGLMFNQFISQSRMMDFRLIWAGVRESMGHSRLEVKSRWVQGKAGLIT